eukprot:gene37766-50980_t
MEDIHNRLEDVYKEYDGNYPDPVKVYISYFVNCQTRNHRYILSYLNHRLEKIRKLRWETGAVLPDRIKQDTLSLRENDYFINYNTILSDYFSNIGMDLTNDLEPPKELLIEIRVLKSCGELMTEGGPIRLDVGSTHFLRRVDVEQLVRQGIVEHVQSDEL